MKQSITIRLWRTLERGCQSLSPEARQRIVAFMRSQRTPRGSYVNRQGEEDLYYTLFGWLLESVLGESGDVRAMEEYLSAIDEQSLDLVHYAAYMRCRLLQKAAQGRLSLLWQSLRTTSIRPFESFATLPNGDPHSPYTQFVWMSLVEDTRNDYHPASLADYRTADGGYANVKGGTSAATNATAAALMVVGQSEGYRRADAEALAAMQMPNGGFKATELSPVPDLLSTATALFALACYDVQHRYDAADFVEAHWLDSGGFAATLLDDKSDVEYLFYGLLALGTL